MNIIKKYFSFICIIISIFLFFYIFYKSEIIYFGNFRENFVTYYIISVLLILFSIVTFYLNDTKKTYAIIITFSIIFSLYFYEGYLNFKSNNAETFNGKLKVLKNLNKTEKTVVASDPGNYLFKNQKIFPFSGISKSKTLHCNENGYYSIYQSDRYGFNNPDKEWDQNEIEYLLIGDSFAHGACVNRPDDIGSVLRRLSDQSVLNLSYNGNGPLIEYATLKEYFLPNVKNILWIYFEGNDLNDLKNELNSNILRKYLTDADFTQQLKYKQKYINKITEQIIKKNKIRKKTNFNFFNFLKLNNTKTLLINTFSKKKIKKPLLQFERILKLTNEFAIKNNAKLYFVYLPDYYRYTGNFRSGGYISVMKIVKQLNIPFIDIHKEVFEKETKPLVLFPFEKDGHYNKLGYKKVAETIYKFTL